MAIAFDAATGIAIVNPGTSASATHTAAGSNRVAVVISWLDGSAAVTATYDGVDMGAAVTTTSRNDGGIYQRIFVLANPSTTSGATVTVSTGASSIIGGMVATYNGCKQTGQPDGSNGVSPQADGTSATSNITVTAEDCWVVGTYINDNGSNLSGSGAFVSRRVNGITGFNGVALFDSNGTVATGSVAYGGSHTASGGQCLAAVSLSPAAEFQPRPSAVMGNPMMY